MMMATVPATYDAINGVGAVPRAMVGGRRRKNRRKNRSQKKNNRRGNERK
jgi:hypothetical protein